MYQSNIIYADLHRGPGSAYDVRMNFVDSNIIYADLHRCLYLHGSA